MVFFLDDDLLVGVLAAGCVLEVWLDSLQVFAQRAWLSLWTFRYGLRLGLFIVFCDEFAQGVARFTLIVKTGNDAG